MEKTWISIIIAFTFGIGVGLYALPNTSTDSQIDLVLTHQKDSDELGGTNGLFEVSDESLAPTLSIGINEDKKSGLNINLTTTNFEFAPSHASLNHVDGEGHAHIYIDGEKIARIYGDWFHLDSLSSGQHEIKVTLNTNDHKGYAVNGEIIQVIRIISLVKDN